MNILLIGPVAEPNTVNGIQTVNRLLASILDEEHNLDVAVPVNQLFTGKIRTKKVKDLTGAGTYGVDWGKALNFSPYDMLVLSGVDIPYRRIFRAFSGKILLWAHGAHVSPLPALTKKEVSRENLKIVCCDELSLRQAEFYGCAEKAVLLDNPVPFEDKEVKPGGGYGVIVSNLNRRKNFPAMIRAAERCAPGVPVRVYGQVEDEGILQLIEGSGQLEYCGTLPHGELMEELAGADFLIHMAVAEAFPSLAVREANGLGVPAILPGDPLYRAAVKDGNVFVSDDPQPVDMKALSALKARKKLAQQTREAYGLDAFRAGLGAIVEGVK